MEAQDKMKNIIRKMAAKNPVYLLMQFPVPRILFPCLAATWVAWNYFRPMLSRNGALLAILLVFVLMLCAAYMSFRLSSKISASFLESLTTSEDGRAHMKSLAITGAATLFVYTLGILSLARSFGLMK